MIHACLCKKISAASDIHDTTPKLKVNAGMQLQVQLDKIEDDLKENDCKARKPLIETLMKKGENQN